MTSETIDWTPTAAHEDFEWECSLKIGSEASALTIDNGTEAFRFFGRPTFWRVVLRNDRGESAVIDGGTEDVEVTGETILDNDSNPDHDHSGGRDHSGTPTSEGEPTNDTESDSKGSALTFELRWHDESIPFERTAGTATTTLHGRLEPGDPTVYWSIEVEIDGVEATVQEVTFPAIEDFRQVGNDTSVENDTATAGEEEALILPDGWGVCIDTPRERPDEVATSVRYPDKHWTMQFLSLTTDSGAGYIGVHDPVGRAKQFRVAPRNNDRTIGFEVGYEPAGISRPTNYVELPYEVAVGTVSGDWYDVAKRYRRWATATAQWTDAGAIAHRDDVPDWLRDGRVWWLLAPRRNDRDRDRTLLSSLTDAVSVPTAVHWYSWHQAPFDVDYPEYFPPRDGFEESVAALEDDDVRVVPYLNARIADPNSPKWDERDLEIAAARTASQRLDPVDRPKQYEEYNDQQFVAMCPATTIWQRTIDEVVDRLDTETDASGVYLDQLAAHAPPRCFAVDHEHQPGDEVAGVEGYRKLVSRLRDRSTTAILTENNAEPYLDLIDAHLMWDSAHAGLIPLYAAVYGEYSLTFGRQYFESDLTEPAAFRSKLAQSFAFGNQLGWIRHGVAEQLLKDEFAPTLEYLRRTAAVVAEIPIITYGERLREPAIDGAPTREIEWSPQSEPRSAVELETVLGGLWRSVAGNELVIGLTNWSRRDRTIEVRGRLPADAIESIHTVTTGDDEGIDQELIGELGPVEGPNWTDDGFELTASMPERSTGALHFSLPQ